MTEKVIKSLADLKENPTSEKIDHISILHELYWDYSNGMAELKPLAVFYLNGFDDLPSLREKHLWKLEEYNELVKPLFESHPKLVGIVNKILIDNGN